MRLYISVKCRIQAPLVCIVCNASFFMSTTPSFPSRSKDDIVIVATGSVTPTGRNPEEAHQAAIDFRTGIRRLAPADIANFDLLCEVKGLKTDKERQELFRCLWRDKCGVGGVIPVEYFPQVESGFYPRTFHKGGEAIVGIPVVQAYIAFAQVREKLPQLFTDNGRIRPDIAPETMVDIANGAGSSVEMVDQQLMELIRAKVNERIGMNYGGKWLLGMLGSMIAGHIASQAGVGGAQNSSNSACASSGLSMFNAFNAIRAGSADVGIVGGSEYATGAITTYVAFDHIMFRSGALTRGWRGNRPPGEALLAFDALRDGFVPGDAAVIIVMMRRRVADLLQIRPLAQVLGVSANTCQSKQFKKSLANGTITGQSLLLERLFKKCGIDPRTLPGKLVHFLHGTGTEDGAINELYAAASVIGDAALEGRYVATGVKERDGHSLGAAFAANVTAAVEGMRHRIIPGLPCTREVDPALRTVDQKVVDEEGVTIDPGALNAVADSILCRRHAPFDPESDLVIADAKGFGGTNAAVALRAEL